MVLKRFMAALFVISLMLGSLVLAGGDEDGVCLVSEKADYKDLKSQFNDFEDDFFHYKSEYKNALYEKDEKLLNKYNYKLENLDDDLKDMRDDVRDLTNDVEDAESCSGKSDLLDNLDDFKEDISDIREKISDLLAEEKMSVKNEAFQQASEPVPTPTAAAKNTEFVVNSLGSGPSMPTPTAAVTATVTVEKAQPSWEQTRQTAWLVAGFIVLLAVVLFLLGMLFRR